MTGRIIGCLTLLILITLSLNAQKQYFGNTFENGGIIPDDGTEFCWPMVVSDIFPSQLDTFFGVKTIVYRYFAFRTCPVKY